MTFLIVRVTKNNYLIIVFLVNYMHRQVPMVFPFLVINISFAFHFI